MARLLLENGANVNVNTKTFYGAKTPLHEAAKFGIALFSSFLSITDLYVRICSNLFHLLGQVEVARELHSYGAIVDAEDTKKWTPLFYACQKGNDHNVGSKDI